MNRTTRLTGMALGALALTVACSDSSTTDRNPTAPGGPSLLSAPNATSGNPFIQCGNKGETCTWETGNINQQKALMREGDVVPFRITVNQDVAKADRLYEIRLKYSTRVGGKNAYDFITRYNASEGAKANLCNPSGNLTTTNLANVSNYCSASGGVIEPGPALPPLDIAVGFAGGSVGTDPKADEIAASTHSTDRIIQVFGGTTGTGVTDPTITYVASKSGDTEDAFLTFRFRTKSGSGAANFIVGWGGHIAQSTVWASQGGGAAQISGSSYHMALEYINELNDNGTVFKTLTSGSRDLQLSAAAVFADPPSLAITKTPTSQTVSAGSPFSWTVTLSNTGTSAASGAVINDNLPTIAGVSYALGAGSDATCSLTGSALECGPKDLAAGATMVAVVNATTTAGQGCTAGTVTNTATGEATGVTTIQAQATVTLQCGSLSLAKTPTSQTIDAGQPFSWTVTLTNAGPGSAFNAVINDNLPVVAGITYTLDPSSDASCSLTAGVLECGPTTLVKDATLTATINATTAPTAAVCAAGSVINTATGQADGSTTIQAQATVTLQCGSLAITKLPTTQTVEAGSPFAWTVTLTNAGPGSALGATITDNLPAVAGLAYALDPSSAASCSLTGNALECGATDLAKNGTIVAKINVTTTPTAALCTAGTVTNTATGDATALSQVSAQATATFQCGSLSITKLPAAQTVDAGQPFSWTVTLKNDGPGGAVDAVINDNLPAVAGITYTLDPSSDASCSLAAGVLECGPSALAKNATIVAKINAITAVTTAVCAAGTITNRATGDATTLSQVAASATVTLNCPALQITKTPDQAGDAGYAVLPGGTATFKITVTNTGAGAATNVVITDPLPNGVLTWQPDQTECAVSSGSLSCSGGDLATLAAGASFVVNVSATIPTNYLVPTNTANTAPPLVVSDGNLVATGGETDWANAGIVCETSGCKLDTSGSTDNSFVQGTKEDSPVPTIETGSIPPNKSDLTRFYAASRKVAVGGSPRDFLYLAWERVQDPSGTTNMDFEINQNPITPSTLSANGVTVVRTAGDVLIKYDLSRGGTNPTLGFHRWVTAASAAGKTPGEVCEASNSFPCWDKAKTIAGSAFQASINSGAVSDPIPPPPGGRTLSARTFGEAGIDLQGSGIFQPGVCLNFGSAYLKSRSSDSFTAALKDFVAPTSLSVQVCEDKLLNNTATVVADGLTAVSDNGQIKVVAPTAFLPTGLTNVHVARLDASHAISTGSAVAGSVTGSSVTGSSVTSGSAMPTDVWVVADAFAAASRREVRRASDTEAEVAWRAGGRTAGLAEPPRTTAAGGGPVAT